MLGLTYSGFGLGYLPGLRMNQAAVTIVRSDECGGFGYTRPENCFAGDRPRYDRLLLGLTIVNIVNSTVLSKLVIIKFSKFGATGFSPILYTESCAANAKEIKKSDYPKTRC